MDIRRSSAITILLFFFNIINANIIYKDSIRLGYQYFTQTDSSGAISCAGCHSLKNTDTFTFYPTALELSLKIKDYSPEYLIERTIDAYFSDLVMDSHDSIAVCDSQLIYIKAYLSSLVKNSNKPKKYLPDYASITISLISIVMLIIAINYFKKYKKAILSMYALIIIIWIITGLTSKINNIGLQESYEPIQPIKFSHKTHAGDNNITCQYCHYHASKAKTAGIPSIEVCMSCHLIIRESKISGAFELSKMYKSIENKVPIEWIRVYKLPAHAKFNHQVHVGTAKLDCSECHGKVEKEHRIRQVNDLSMQWCNDCHKKSYSADLNTNASINVFENMKQNCNTCHY